MKNMRKVLAALLVFLLLFVMAACGTGADSSDASQNTTTDSGGAPDTQQDETTSDNPYAGLSVEAVQAKVAEIAATAEWDAMAVDSGITDSITDLVYLEDDYTIRIGLGTGGKNEQNYTAALFQAYIEALTLGKVQVEIFPAGQLGTTTQMIQGVLEGSITSFIFPLEYLMTYAPASGVSSIPFMFNDSAQAARIFNSDPTMSDYLKECGFYPAGYLYEHSAVLLTDRKIQSLDDFNGMKIWCLASTLSQMEIEAYGASPTLMNVSDVALALQNGTIDGTYSGVTLYNAMGFYESASYLHSFPSKSLCGIFLFSTEYMNSLPDEVRTLIDGAAEYVIDNYEKNYVDASINISVSNILSNCEEVNSSEELIADMKAATSDIHEYFKTLDNDCAAMYKTMTELIEADNASGNVGSAKY